MYQVDVYVRVCRACLVEGQNIRNIASEFGLNRRTVQKMLKHAVLAGYQRKQIVHQPKLGPYLEFIVQLIAEDKTRPKKQRHTAKRIFTRLQEVR
jgi:predicted transcriptional regulator